MLRAGPCEVSDGVWSSFTYAKVCTVQQMVEQLAFIPCCASVRTLVRLESINLNRLDGVVCYGGFRLLVNFERCLPSFVARVGELYELVGELAPSDQRQQEPEQRSGSDGVDAVVEPSSGCNMEVDDQEEQRAVAHATASMVDQLLALRKRRAVEAVAPSPRPPLPGRVGLFTSALVTASLCPVDHRYPVAQPPHPLWAGASSRRSPDAVRCAAVLNVRICRQVSGMDEKLFWRAHDQLNQFLIETE